MYYKLYRRRQYIYLGIFVVCILFLLSQKSQTNDDSVHGEKNIEENPNIPHMPLKKNDGDIHLPEKPRVNMQNYVEPPVCKGCPGENGGAVFLNVILLFIVMCKLLVHSHIQWDTVQGSCRVKIKVYRSNFLG
jgi:hypothetical protein